uniref:Uncharacterized protein n=1 Tax=Candidatus Kentrum sp. LPFa TaxID=2126335 RepID=A0A450W8C4_9GAMM|nr:MAG: hypothetical protein BECKLPF1236A_GA0070988_100863 [Candidatus Kentron sp. LPFa]VFK31272.1 MAG: hypothetical protein BECKLPF1236C_GA0070990_101333 [Candidatus Kentron sp. LPFa]
MVEHLKNRNKGQVRGVRYRLFWLAFTVPCQPYNKALGRYDEGFVMPTGGFGKPSESLGGSSENPVRSAKNLVRPAENFVCSLNISRKAYRMAR